MLERAYLKVRLRLSRTKLRAPLVWVRHRGLKPCDVFIGSFPRSGNYWLRFQLAEALTQQSYEFEEIGRAVPWVGQHSKAFPIRPIEGRLISTHEPYRPAYRKAIYIVRDVRDVVLSVYAQAVERRIFHVFAAGTFDNYLALFLEGKATPFGKWPDHVRSWIDSQTERQRKLTILRFEDMRANPVTTLANVVQFLGVSANQEVIRKVLADNRLEKMRRKEDRSPAIQKACCEEGRFIRRGLVGGWREMLTEEQARRLNRHAGDLLRKLGYGDLECGSQPCERGSLVHSEECGTSPIRTRP